MAWAVLSSCMADAALARFVRFWIGVWRGKRSTIASSKSVSQACLPREFHGGVFQQCLAERLAGESSKRALQECPTRDSCRSFSQECHTKVCYNSVLQERFAREFQNSVQRGVFQGSCKSVAQEKSMRQMSDQTVKRKRKLD